MDKKTIRKKYLRIRDKIHNPELDKEISQNLLKDHNFLQASSIFITVNIGSEINTKDIIKKSFELNKKVYIPKIDLSSKQLVPTEISSHYSDLIDGTYNIPEPKNFPKSIVIPDLVIVPGLVFSEDGYRIGYGGGYYDRFIEKYKPKTTAIVYDDLILKNLPIESFDYPVNQIISEKRTLNINNNDNY